MTQLDWEFIARYAPLYVEAAKLTVYIAFWGILFALLAAETCVCDLSELLNASVSAVSHQLRILRQARLVRYRRAGKTVFYSLADEHVRSLLSQGLEHVQE